MIVSEQPAPRPPAARDAPRYRRDVDGLRAVAIIPVLLFHAGLRGFSGGFVGVDVFFVISGFLITGVIAHEIAADRFSIARFYVRRARRILPALLLVLAATLAAGLVLLAPSELSDLGKSCTATAVSASNVLFWWATDYFSRSADLKPLLMTWSLGVEEQFYLLWPLLLLFASRRRKVAVVLGLIAAASFLLSARLVHRAPALAFYLLPTRAWELLTGAALALGFIPGPPERERASVRDAISVLGLVLIGVAVVAIDRDTPFPGTAALLPCLGTGCLLWAGERAVVNRRLLGTRPMVFVGLISYSLYLWHWPLLSFTRILHLGALPPAPAAAAVVTAFVLACLSWRFVEQPFRRPSSASHARVLRGYGVAVALAAVAGGWVWSGRGIPRRMAPEAAWADAARKDWNPLRPACFNQAASPVLPKPECTVGPAGEGQLVAIWGDSHADAIAPAVRAWATQRGRGFVQITNQSCPPLPGVQVIDGSGPLTECVPFTARALDAIVRDRRIGTVVLAARWAIYTETTRFGNETGTRAYLVDDQSQEQSPANSRRAFVAALQGVTARLAAAGKDVYVLAQVPEIGFDVPDCLAHAHMPFSTVRTCAVAADAVRARLRFTSAAIEELARATPTLHALFPADVLCGGAECPASWRGDALYIDNNHLSLHGALHLGEGLFAGRSAR